MNLKKLNSSLLSLNALDLLLGLLAIGFVQLEVPSTLVSLSSLVFIVTVYKNYTTLKTGTEVVAEFKEIYNKSAITLSAIDVIVGFITITASALAAVGVIITTIRLGKVINGVVQIKKAQSITRIARKIGVIGVIYIILRGGNKMLKSMFKGIWAGFKYVLVTNPITIILGVGGLALLIYNGTTGGELINYIASLVNDPTLAETLFYGAGGSAVFVAVLKQGLETDAVKTARLNAAAALKAEKSVLKAQAALEAEAEEEARIALEAETQVALDVKKAQILAAKQAAAETAAKNTTK